MRYRTLKARAEITVFLTLLFGIISALTVTIIESARNQATRIQVERVMQTAIHSCFSEYNQDLLKYYEIFAIDSSYRTDTGNVDNIRSHLKEYAIENFKSSDADKTGSDWLKLTVNESELRQYEILSDDNGRPLLNQICEYMSISEKKPTKAEMSSVGKLMSPKSDGEFIAAFSDVLEHAGNNPQNPAQKIYETAIATGLMEYIPDTGYNYKSVQNDCPSRRTLQRGTGFRNKGSKKAAVDEDYYLNAYIMNHFSNCLSPYDHSYMNAETEYLISGKYSEKDCISECAKWILAQREARNLPEMENNERVLKDTEELSVFLCENFGGDQFYIQQSLIYAWTYVESVIELSRLYRGGEIDMSRGISDPVVPLEKMLSFMEYLGGGNGNGQDYSSILAGMLTHTDKTAKIKRCMDIIEMNMISLGHKGFRTDQCVTYFKAHITVGSGYGHGCEIEREYGYCKE